MRREPPINESWRTNLAQRGHIGARQENKTTNILDRRPVSWSTPARVGRSGARRGGRAVTVARIKLTALRANGR